MEVYLLQLKLLNSKVQEGAKLFARMKVEPLCICNLAKEVSLQQIRIFAVAYRLLDWHMEMTTT
jgi:hypothetical protein